MVEEEVPTPAEVKGFRDIPVIDLDIANRRRFVRHENLSCSELLDIPASKTNSRHQMDCTRVSATLYC